MISNTYRYAIALLLACTMLQAEPENQTTAPYTLIEDRTNLPILAPYYADRKSLKVRLNNGLEAYIVSDPQIEKSAAALLVKAGSWQDPAEHPGLAHFLEHMLFLGTKKFPEESSYDAFIRANGGNDNAFTDDLSTVFMFQIDNRAFPEALDRFAEFFKDPLLNPSGVAREMQAIAQEYAGNVENEDVRLTYVDKALANPNHPDHAFNIGNAATLGSVTTEHLRQWFLDHYSANLMKVAIYSPLPLDTLKDLVVQNFGGIPNRNLPPFSTLEHSFSKDFDGKMAYIVPFADMKVLTISWELPKELVNQTEIRPDDLICYVLGHEGKGTLFTLLQNEGLAEELLCGKLQSGPENAIFYLQFKLTPKGVKEAYRVIEKSFQALVSLRETGIPRYIFDDMQKMDIIRYQYPSQEEAFQEVMNHVVKMRDTDIATYPEHFEVLQKFDPQVVQKLLNILTPANAHFALAASPKETGVKPDRKEPWLGVEYAVKPIPEKILKSWQNAKPIKEIVLPPENPFIPKHLTLVKSYPAEKTDATLYPHPKLIEDNDFGKVYYSADARYKIPKIIWKWKVKSPQLQGNDPTKMALADLYVKYLKEVLNPDSYPAKMAGLEYDIERQNDGIEFEITGYSENAELLFRKIGENLKLPELSEDKFKILKQSLLTQYQNSEKDSPYQVGIQILKDVIYEDFATDAEKAEALPTIHLQQFQNFLSSLFEKTYTEAMFYGNMTEKQAQELSKNWQKALQSAPYPIKDQKPTALIELPANCGPYFLQRQTKGSGNAILLAIEKTPYSFKSEAILNILSQMLKDSFFTELRTRQQTGYLVFATGEELQKHLFMLFLIQSHTHDPRDLLARIELFLELSKQRLEMQEFTEEEFQTIKKSLENELRQAPQNLKKMGEELYKLAFDYAGDFNWYEQRIAAMEALSYTDFIQESQEWLSRQNKRRVAVLVRGKLADQNQLRYIKAKNLDWFCQKARYTSADEVHSRSNTNP